MTNVLHLIEKVIVGGPDSGLASTQLRSTGAGVIPQLVDAIQTAEPESIWPLRSVLSGLRGKGVLREMIRLLKSNNPEVLIAAFVWLGRCKDSRASQALLKILGNQACDKNRKTLAAEALGNGGNRNALAPLLAAASEIINPDKDDIEVRSQKDCDGSDDLDLRLFISIAVAAAKLGSHVLGKTIVKLTYYGKSKDPRHQIVRLEAVRAFEIVVTPGAFHALCRVLSDGPPEVAEAALIALRYLGVKQLLPRVIPIIDDRRGDLPEAALRMIQGLTGEWPDGKQSAYDLTANKVKLWWRKRSSSFHGGICYRLGKPIQLAEVVELLGDPRQLADVAKELKTITGHDFGYDDDVAAERQRRHVLSSARRWLKKNGNRFLPGRLYKYGKEQSLIAAMRRLSR